MSGSHTKTEGPRTVDETHVALGRYIKRLREERGLTQTLLAERSDLSVDTIGRLERGSFSPTLRVVRQIAGGLGIRLAALFDEQSWPYVSDPHSSD